MRCGCSQCGAFMVHAEGRETCVCPECGCRCSACLGTDTVVSREKLKDLSFIPWISRDIEDSAGFPDAAPEETE